VKQISTLLRFALLGLLLSAPGSAPAEPVVRDGTFAGDPATLAPQMNLGQMQPFRTYEGAHLASGGTGMRNHGSGAIQISGLVPGARIIGGWVYWHIMTNGTPTRRERQLTIRQLAPELGRASVLIGRAIGRGTSCWGGVSTVLRAWAGPEALSGNGLYQVSVVANRFAHTDGQSLYDAFDLPAINGVSLLVLSDGDSSVMIYDQPMAGQLFIPNAGGLQMEFMLPEHALDRDFTALHMITSDGNRGGRRGATGAQSDEQLFVGTVEEGWIIAGPGSQFLEDSLFNGTAGGPLTQSWDNALLDLSGNFRGSVQSAVLTIGSERPSNSADCMTGVAAALERSDTAF
jgi:hypothetical protein